MIYIAVIVTLSLLGLLMFIPKFKASFEKYALGINFILTLFATLVGVLMAIYISNYEAEKKEQKDLIKLLGAAKVSVSTSIDYSEKINNYYETLADDSPDRSDFYVKNKPPYPEYLDSFLAQDIISKNLSAQTLESLTEAQINLKKSLNYNIDMYFVLLQETEAIIDLEIQFQQNLLSANTLEQEQDKLSAQIRSKLNSLQLDAK
ncbi:hypothetical protein HR060_07905 [Catenovulum sp. SM1970]|uniref:hypothetical protein n=1 Tax=Marinifaba aquimaris TaxID=2741323 RepID=UPI001572479B|nr:hypothetical protein [Marinifaba aquimaris]NTS76793.1 hypothetical protein [Marinifaba aquimaris]